VKTSEGPTVAAKDRALSRQDYVGHSSLPACQTAYSVTDLIVSCRLITYGTIIGQCCKVFCSLFSHYCTASSNITHPMKSPLSLGTRLLHDNGRLWVRSMAIAGILVSAYDVADDGRCGRIWLVPTFPRLVRVCGTRPWL
jgi:hypothetical protein